MAKCAVCGRTLTSLKSIAAGVGPVCGRSGKGRRHRARLAVLGGGGHYSNGAGGHGAAVVPPAIGEPMERDEALAVIKRVANLP